MQAKKSLGQHFLVDLNVAYSIVSLIEESCRVLEIGPGRGALTELLLNKGFIVDAVEFDSDMIEHLHNKFTNKKSLNIIQADASAYVLNKKYCVVGNLPYNLSKKIISNMIQQKQFIEKMIFMVQKEVAATMTAKPNSKTYSKFSIFVQMFCNVKKIFDVKPGAFWPTPKVMSSVVLLKPYKKSLLNIEIDHTFFNFLTIFFSQPNKTVRNNLKKYIALENLSENSILNARPRQLSIQEIYNFFSYLKERI